MYTNLKNIFNNMHTSDPPGKVISFEIRDVEVDISFMSKGSSLLGWVSFDLLYLAAHHVISTYHNTSTGSHQNLLNGFIKTLSFKASTDSKAASIEPWFL